MSERDDDVLSTNKLVYAPTEVVSGVATGGLSLEDRGFAERYDTRTLLGAGGMGEVHLCRDNRVGRDVAMKVIQPSFASEADLRARFIREARVQGQLEHPAIVPDYDMGVAPDGSVYFTMKRIEGSAFDDVIERLRAGTERRTPRQLLAAFSSLCQAVDFAHMRGVLHRDLKPANLMLGDFGETYVLDWGLAKVLGADDDESRRSVAPAGEGVETMHGEVMGTPGYMAPEQMRAEDVDARTDVYSLGVVLFELLAREPLHARSSREKIMLSTLTGVDARPSVRAPDLDIPPELEDICVRATAMDPAARMSAREMSDGIERFLDGDRDLARRKELSALHADRAEEAAVTGGLAGRKRAMREIGRALAFDPDNDKALRALAGLLLTPPTELPPEAEAAIERAQDDAVRVAARAGGIVRLSVLLLAPLLVWMHVRDRVAVAAIVGTTLVAAAAAFVNARMRRPRTFIRDLQLVTTLVAGMAVDSVYGPFILVPTVATITALGFSLGAFRARDRVKIVVMSCASIVVPVVLELTGAWRPSYVFANGEMIVRPQALGISEASTVVFLLASSCVMVVAAGFFASRTRSALSAAERKNQIHAWHLHHLVPSAADDAPRAYSAE